MSVPVMQVWIMGMLVPHGLMVMPVGMWFCHFTLMGVLMMLVMHMAMLMFQFDMVMIMLMPFRQMQPSTKGHEESGYQDDGRQRCAEKYSRYYGPDKWRGPVVCPSPRGS